MPLYLLFDPILHLPETPAGVANTEAIDPSVQHRIDNINDPIDRAGTETPEHVLEFLAQCRPRLHFGRTPRTPDAPQGPHAAKVKARKANAFPLRQVHPASLLKSERIRRHCGFSDDRRFAQSQQ